MKMDVTLSVREELNFVAGERISLSRIGQIEISTVRLPCQKGETVMYETCLFPVNGERGDRAPYFNSTVAATYYDRLDALIGHMRFLNVLQFVLEPNR